MNIHIEYINERNVSKKWNLIQKWNVQSSKIIINEIKVNYKNKNYLVIYPLNYSEKKSPVTIKEEENGKIYNANFNTELFTNFNQSKLEKILKKIKIK
jgi:hypothetical protein